MSRCSGVLGAWAVVWKPGARSFETGAGALPAQALPPAAGTVLFWIALLHRHLRWVWHWWRACRQPVGPHGLMCAPSQWNAGAGENGWADGLTGGALRAGPDHPQKTSVERLLEPGWAASIATARELNEAVI